jgi:uncharacterized protein (DUF2147 family)
VRRTCLIMAGLCLSVGTACADPVGEWMVEKGYAKIRIENCSGSLWGAVASEQKAGTDSKNPDPSKRSRPTLGMPVLLDMKPVEANKWSGQIYNSEDGKTYQSNISLANPDLLQVRGCVLGFLCGGEDWTRVKDAPALVGAPTAPGVTGSLPKPGGAATGAPKPTGPSSLAPPKPVDIATASVEEFCSAVLLNGAGPAH